METPAPAQPTKPDSLFQVKLSLPPFTTLFVRSWTQYREQIGLITGIALVPTGFALIQTYLMDEPTIPTSVYIVFSCFAMLATLLAQFALFWVFTNGVSSVSMAYNTALQHIGAYVWISALTLFVVLGGAIVFLIPAIIFGVLLAFSVLMYPAEGKRGISALAQSWFYVKGYWWGTLGKIVIFNILLGVASLVVLLVFSILVGEFESDLAKEIQLLMYDQTPLTSAFGIVLQTLVVFPLQTLYLVQLFRSLRDIKTNQPGIFDEVKVVRALKIFLSIGVVVTVLVSIGIGYASVTDFERTMNILRSAM